MGSDPWSQATAKLGRAPGQPSVRTRSAGWFRLNTGTRVDLQSVMTGLQKRINHVETNQCQLVLVWQYDSSVLTLTCTRETSSDQGVWRKEDFELDKSHDSF